MNIGIVLPLFISLFCCEDVKPIACGFALVFVTELNLDGYRPR